MTDPLFLSLRDVNFRYDGAAVLRKIDCDIRRGEFVGIIGPNGSGKSTLLKIVSGFLKTGTGEVRLLGEKIDECDTSELAKMVAVLPQSIDVPFSYTGEEFIRMGRYPHQSRWRSRSGTYDPVVSSVLEMLGIEHLRNREVNSLSEGERQNIFIAQCLAQDPVLLLLDEPVSHLDIRHQMHVLEILENLNRDGLTILMAIHDLNLAAQFCSRLILLSQGSIYADGPPEEVLTYQNLESVYQTIVVVRENPLTSKPFVIPVPRKYVTK